MSRERRVSNPAPGRTSMRYRGSLGKTGEVVGQFRTSPNGYRWLASSWSMQLVKELRRSAENAAKSQDTAIPIQVELQVD